MRFPRSARKTSTTASEHSWFPPLDESPRFPSISCAFSGTHSKGVDMGTARMGLFVLALAVVAAGCQSKMHDENRALWQQNRELQAKLASSSSAPTAEPPKTDPSQLTALQSEIAQRDAKISELQNQLRQPAPGQAEDPQLSAIETTYDKTSSKLTVNVPGDVLFAPGDATVRDEAKSTLDKVAASLKKD